MDIERVDQDMNDPRSYAHSLSRCEIEAWNILYFCLMAIYSYICYQNNDEWSNHTI